MCYAHTHCIVSIRKVFPKKTLLCSPTDFAQLLSQNTNDIFPVNVEIAKIKQFDPQYFPFNSRFWNKTGSIPTLILFEPALTAVFFETGAMPVPTKSRNPTICGSGDPFH